jgi:lipid A oxidase
MRTSEYQLAGPAVQVLGGIEWRVSPHISLFLEYKLSCSAIRGAVKGGGSVETRLCTHQLVTGPAWHLRPLQAVSP